MGHKQLGRGHLCLGGPAGSQEFPTRLCAGEMERPGQFSPETWDRDLEVVSSLVHSWLLPQCSVSPTCVASPVRVRVWGLILLPTPTLPSMHGDSPTFTVWVQELGNPQPLS